MTKPDYYAIFGLSRNASPQEVQKAYLEAARRLHPDKNLSAGETELFLEAQEAYEVLSNPKKRSKYDASLPPEKPSEKMLEQKFQFSRGSILRLDEPQVIYLLLEFSVPAGLKARPSPALNLCLLLDRSTSMQGHKMDVVKATAIQIMRKMKPQDIFSVVTFSDRAEVLIPASRSIELSKQEARIQMLQPSGGTEVFSGLELGFFEIKHHSNPSHVNHIILLTDGRTYGDESKCMELAMRAAENGIGISGLGVGSEWNDDFLDELASITGGNSMYAPQPQDIQHALLDRFNQLGKAYADEIRLEFKPVKGVELRYAFRIEPVGGLLSIDSPVLLGSVISDKSLKVMLEFIVSPDAIEDGTVTILDGKLMITLAGQSTPVKPLSLNLVRPVLNESDPQPPPMEIVDALSRLKLYRMQEQARLEVSAGNYDQAVEHLSRLATHLLAQGERELAKTVLLEAENIQKEKSISQQGGKEIKYGTRALLMSGKRMD
jgi:Ca-activated chloride channel homolog